MQFIESINPEKIEELELVSFDGPVELITNEGPEFDRAIEELSNCRMLGFDTETKPIFQHHAPRHGTALLQLSSSNKSWLFRLHTLGLPQPLADILSDKHITKIGAAVLDDIRGLQRYNDFEPGRFIDLQSFVEDYGIKDKSVKKLTAIILGKRISKAQQCSNWEAATLNDAQISYAATDAWICLKMYRELLTSRR
jgi:ribonuclease D